MLCPGVWLLRLGSPADGGAAGGAAAADMVTIWSVVEETNFEMWNLPAIRMCNQDGLSQYNSLEFRQWSPPRRGRI